MKTKFLLPVVLIATLLLTGNVFGGSTARTGTLTFSAPVYEIEDLVAELQEDGNNVLVSGNVKNLGHSPVKGYVIVYFKNEKGVVVHSVETDVNKNRSFSRGKTGSFEISANIESTPDIQNVVIEFVNK
ncbi:MAG: hypothetical protein ABIJ52_08950 [Pseudomonadota bacterium]|nr:hypothetical protein [Pseudomonadota bacterium]MBU1397625.1 hypothetical protein [Pseudomonadota bacterium]MBU1569243.1 hypothetical protein [Pseudomonadota bacterium]